MFFRLICSRKLSLFLQVAIYVILSISLAIHLVGLIGAWMPSFKTLYIYCLACKIFIVKMIIFMIFGHSTSWILLIIISVWALWCLYFYFSIKNHQANPVVSNVEAGVSSSGPTYNRMSWNTRSPNQHWWPLSKTFFLILKFFPLFRLICQCNKTVIINWCTGCVNR